MKFEDVPGWLTVTDQTSFSWVLEYQNANEPPGDLLEIGVYKGKSAIHMGRYRKFGEKFTVIDLFDDAFGSEHINKSAAKTYKDLTKTEFEANYAAFHREMPKAIRGPSSEIINHVEPGTCRFIHIDASHMYEHVKEDIESARKLLRPDGIVVFDDYRTEHTPGTAAAVWEAILTGGMKPVFHTVGKMYATFGDPKPMQDEIVRRAANEETWRTAAPILIKDMPIIRMYWWNSKVKT